jgi:hypothetical protein
MSSYHHHGRNDGGATSGGETLDKTHNNQSLNLNVVATTHNIVLGSWKHPWTHPYWAHTCYTARRPKYGLTAPGELMETRLVSQFLSTQILVGYETSPIQKIVSLSFQIVQ